MQLLSKLRENCTLFCWERYQEPLAILAILCGVETASKHTCIHLLFWLGPANM